MPMFISDLFIEEEYMELGNVSTMPKEHKCICSKSEASIPEATSCIEGLTVIMRKEWIEEAESSNTIIQIYCNFRILLYTIVNTHYGPFFDHQILHKSTNLAKANTSIGCLSNEFNKCWSKYMCR
jgi:hypothetical protein